MVLISGNYFRIPQSCISQATFEFEGRASGSSTPRNVSKSLFLVFQIPISLFLLFVIHQTLKSEKNHQLRLLSSTTGGRRTTTNNLSQLSKVIRSIFVFFFVEMILFISIDDFIIFWSGTVWCYVLILETDFSRSS